MPRSESLDSTGDGLDTLAKMTSVMDNLPIAVTELDREHYVLFANRTALEWAGVTADEILGRRVPDILPPDDWQFHRPYNEQALNGSRVTARNVLVTPSGERRVMEFTHNPRFGPDGDVVGYYTYASDITERDALERKLLQSERLGAIGQLTGGLAHDFNNLLSVILGNAELLAARVSDDRRSDVLLSEIISAAAQGSEITKRLISFARQQDLSPKVIDVNTLVLEQRDLLRRALGSEIELIAELDRDTPAIRVDDAQLRNALLNLALNAKGAMPDGGRLSIATETTDLDHTPIGPDSERLTGRFLRVMVSDTGTGMSEEIRERAHEPFFTTKDIGAGSGLGLSTVYGFVTQSGGQLEISSSVGQGTTVRLYFPAASSA